MNRLEAKLEKIGSDPKVTAKAVGLRYTSAASKGYHRIKKEKSFSYFDDDQKTEFHQISCQHQKQYLHSR